MLTPFGRALRKLRIDKHVTLRELSNRINVAPSFLSAVENGRKSMPGDFIDKICTALDLGSEHRTDLVHQAELSRREYTISTGSRNDFDKELVSVFARQFGGLDDADKREIMAILKGERSE